MRVRADLQLDVSPGGDEAATELGITIQSESDVVHVRLDRVPDLAARPSSELIRTVAAGLVGQGLRVVVEGPTGAWSASAPASGPPGGSDRSFVRRTSGCTTCARRCGPFPAVGERPWRRRDRTAGDAVHAALHRAATGSDRAPPAAHLHHPRPGRRRGSSALLPGCRQCRRPVEGVLPPAGGQRRRSGGR